MAVQIKSLGKTYTKLAKDNGPIRELEISSPSKVLHESVGDEIPAEGLQARFEDDPFVMLGHVISLLDKTVKKTDNLKRYNKGAYVDRCKIAAQLKRWLDKQYQDIFAQHPDEKERFDMLWKWRVMPAAKDDIKINDLDKDENYQAILEIEKPEPREKFVGRWASAFIVAPHGNLNVQATAKIMELHLTDTAYRINGKKRVLNPKGQLAARADAIVHSIKDPVEDFSKPADFEKNDAWGEAEEKIYQKCDFAKIILHGLLKDSFPWGDKPVAAVRSHFGERLHTHFKRLEKFTSPNTPERKRIWALHNDVRTFYQKLAMTERLKITFKQEAARRYKLERFKKFKKLSEQQVRQINDIKSAQKGFKTELTQSLPQDCKTLFARMRGKKNNAHILDLISLGKIIVHASDIFTDEVADANALNKRFQEHIKYFRTSDGQSKIKNQEAFTRVWRNAVSMSSQTIQVLTKLQFKDDENSDPLGALKDLKALITKGNLDSEHYENMLGIIFGNRDHPDLGGSRAEIFMEDEHVTSQSMLWSLTRLAGEIRHRSNHFSTKKRLTRLLKNGILTPVKDSDGFDNMGSAQAHKSTFERFAQLLAYDQRLDQQRLRDELTAIDYESYVPEIQDATILKELEGGTDFSQPMPKFMSVIRRAVDLSKNEQEQEQKDKDSTFKIFNHLLLDSHSMTEMGENKFRVGMLRLLYQSGFKKWLEVKLTDQDFLKTKLDSVITAKRARTEKIFQDKGWVHANEEVFQSLMAFKGVTDIQTLFSKLYAHNMIAEGLNQSYKANPAAQKNVANDIEKFRQELFAFLFKEYLYDNDLCAVLEYKSHQRYAEAMLQETGDQTFEDWEAAFYTWLYLVPVEHISRLRQQLMKNNILDEAGQKDPTYQAMDRLMALYLRVEGTGFNGHEHDFALEKIQLYENKEQFKTIVSNKAEDHHLSYAGIRRGLREIVRFGGLPTLKHIFEQHKVTEQEVGTLNTADSDDIAEDFSKKLRLHQDIIKQAKEKNPNIETLQENIKEYLNLVTKTRKHNEQVASARLTDFARIHRLLMKITGRLLDYTQLWERDMNYLYWGMLYAEYLQGGAQSDWLMLKGKAVCHNNGLSIWTDSKGFTQHKFFTKDGGEHTRIGEKEHQEIFSKCFGGGGNEGHPKDIRGSHDNKSAAKGKITIRNDFAHFNILKEQDLDLSRKINHVRSMFGYNRKFKNAISKSIRKIVQQEGMDITWQFERDRLKDAKLKPMIETHLTMVPKKYLKNSDDAPKSGSKKSGFNPPTFKTTDFEFDRVTLRYLKMANTLFGNAK